MAIVRQILHNALARSKGGLLLLIILIFLFAETAKGESPSLLVFAGAASKPPTEEVAKLFEKERGLPVQVTYGGSGFVLSQMKLARKGDVYFPGSSDFMEKAKRDKLVFPETEKIIAYLIPAINVQKGNPREIRTLKDLLKPGLRLAIADPETVCVGTYAVEVIEKNLSSEEKMLFRKNLVTTVESCERTANILSLKGADAVLGWEVFAHWDRDRIETILLGREQIPRIGYIPAAVSRFTQARNGAEKFVEYLISPESKAVFKKHGYLLREDEARHFTLGGTPVGGEYLLPKEWRRGR